MKPKTRPSRVAVVVVAVLASAFAFVSSAPAAVHQPNTVSRGDCTSVYDIGFGLHNDEQGVHADWESNPCGFTMQTRAICVSSVTGSVYHHDSGEVHGLEIDDWATCNLLDCMTEAQIDPQDTGHFIDKGDFICGAPSRPATVQRLAPGCHRAALERTSGAPNVQVVFCLPGPRPAGATRLLVVNDGSDSDFDQGDVILSFWVVPHG